MVVATAGFLLFSVAAGGDARSAAPASFDLAVKEMSVKQLSSTPMFRTVEISCAVLNRGPRSSNVTGWLLVSRPGETVAQVLKVVPIPKVMEAGEWLQVRAQGFAWVPTAVPYRCEIQFGGASSAGDADPANDFAELTFPSF